MELIDRPENADYTINRMLLGTHTSGKGTDQLMIAEVMLPKTATETAGKDITELYDEERQGMSSHSFTSCLGFWVS